VRATASPVATEWAPAREPAAESSNPQPSSVGIEPPTTTSVPMASNLPIPTLVGTADPTIPTHVRFIYECHLVKVKVTGAKRSKIPIPAM